MLGRWAKKLLARCGKWLLKSKWFAGDYVYWLSNGSLVTSAVYTFVKLKIPAVLKDGPHSSAEIAQATGVSEHLLKKYLHALASIGFLDQRKGDVFSLNNVSKSFHSDTEDMWSNWFMFMGEQAWQTTIQLPKILRDAQSGYELAYGKGCWEFNRDNPDQRLIFDKAMGGFTRWQAHAVVRHFDLQKAKTFVDVGGGQATLSATLLRRYPELKGQVIDLAESLRGAQENLLEAEVSDRCELIAGNFFEHVPGDSDVYFIKHVLHDWDDRQAVRILTSIAKAMRPDSRLVIVEGILPAEGDTGAVLKWRDIAQICNSCNGRERNRTEWHGLLEESGLEFAKAEQTDIADVCLIECKKKASP